MAKLPSPKYVSELMLGFYGKKTWKMEEIVELLEKRNPDATSEEKARLITDANALAQAYKDQALAEISEEKKQISNDIMANIDALDNNWISDTVLLKLEDVFKDLITAIDLDKINTKISQKHNKRKISYRDISYVYCVHRLNIMKNCNNASPFYGIIKMSRYATNQKLLEKPIDSLHITFCMAIFEGARLHKKLTWANKEDGKAATYELLPNDKIDAIFDQ